MEATVSKELQVSRATYRSVFFEIRWDFLENSGKYPQIIHFNRWEISPKSSILIGFSIINHPFWGTPIFGKGYR